MRYKQVGACPLVALLFSASEISRARAVELTETVRAAIALPCSVAPGTALQDLAARLPMARSRRNWVHHSQTDVIKRRMLFDVAGHELTLQYTGPTGNPRSVTARLTAPNGKRPTILAVADGCTIHTARRLRYDAEGRPEWLDRLDSDLSTTNETEPLNPPVPAGKAPVGVPVGLMDSGVNYLLPEIGSRLARDHDGRILGYDYWDLDRRPFDISLTADPFFPEHHGTRTASLVLDGAPLATLVPYRYPRDDMARMTELIEHAALRKVRIMNVSMASRDRGEWSSFREAARHHPRMLFIVAAGNHGLNIEDHPIYPAALDLDNMFVVTAAGADGRLTRGVNWGPRTVDVMVEGEGVPALHFDGERRPVTGSSYATARVSALAVCLLARHPEYTASELKAALLREALPDEDGRVKAGFIPNATLDQACKAQNRSSAPASRVRVPGDGG